MSKLNVAIIFGGDAAECEASINSAINLIDNLSREKYNILPVYVNALGNYFLFEGKPHVIRAAEWENFGTKCQINLDRQDRGLLRISGERAKNVPVDIAIPLLRGGLSGGSLQGALEISGIKYIGADILSDAMAADNVMMKTLAKSLNITCAKHLIFDTKELKDFEAMLRSVRYKIGYPCRVKPLKKGLESSVIARNKKELEDAILATLLFNDKIIVEKVVLGRELICALLPFGDEIKLSSIGEFLPDGELYLSPELGDEVIAKVNDNALKLFSTINAQSPACLTFIVEEKTGAVIFSDINVTLSFSDMDVFPKLIRGLGLGIGEIADELIVDALVRK